MLRKQVSAPKNTTETDIGFASGCVDPSGAQQSVLCGVFQHSGNSGAGILGLHFCWNMHLEVVLVAWESGGTLALLSLS